jgi:hypothetical protein
MEPNAEPQYLGFGIHAIWNEVFSNIRDLQEHEPYVEVVRRKGFNGDGIDPLLKDDWYNTLSPSDLKSIRELCPNSIVPSLRNGISLPGGPDISRLGAWLDDRTVDAAGRVRFRPYANPLSARQLYLMLKVDVSFRNSSSSTDLTLTYIWTALRSQISSRC